MIWKFALAVITLVSVTTLITCEYNDATELNSRNDDLIESTLVCSRAYGTENLDTIHDCLEFMGH